MTATLDASTGASAAHDTEATLAGEPPARQFPVPAALAPWDEPNRMVGWLITLLVTAIAAGTRFFSVGFPPGKNFDEVYYTTEAQELLRFGYEDDRGYMFIVHPPLGKWLIGLTSWLWGNYSIGWRVAPALAGTISVLLIVRVVRRMLRSTLFGAIAGLLLSLDGVSLVLSRTALLDIFLQTFVLAGFTALVADRDQMRRRLAGLLAAGGDLQDGVPSLGPRPWRLVAGVMFGAGCAVKWSALSFFVLFVLLSLWWDRGALRAAGARTPVQSTLIRSGLPALGSLVVAPVATYLLSYLGWFTGENGWNRHWADTHSTSATLHLLGINVPFTWAWVPAPIRSLGSYTLQAYHFHETLYSPHPSAAGPWNWLVLGRPTLVYYDGSSKACGAATCSREMLLIGTPLMWWAFIPALLWLLWYWLSSHDWRAGAVWVGFAAGWLVWFQDLRRTMFLFYTAPLVPFLVIGLTIALGTMLGPGLPEHADDALTARWVTRRRWGIAGVAGYLGVVVADFVWMWPIFTGGLLTFAQWHARMWFDSWVPR